MEIPVIIEISARHIHLSQRDADVLFGEGYEFKILKELSQKGQYAYEESVEIESESGVSMNKVRVMGPVRDSTYAEFSTTDLYQMKITAPTMTESYDDEQMATPIFIRGLKGEIKRSAAIVKQRHIHCDTDTAKKYGLKDKAEVSLRCGEERLLTLHKVVVRVDPEFTLRAHINTDEANAAGVQQNGEGLIIFKEERR